ncbi:hypothetical protein CLU79DRAFT_715357 [Phycomyces nitens]|nr:hypothetical protein CLU79DRAFT_715357 [Phycomyces nitens]
MNVPNIQYNSHSLQPNDLHIDVSGIPEGFCSRIEKQIKLRLRLLDKDNWRIKSWHFLKISETLLAESSFQKRINHFYEYEETFSLLSSSYNVLTLEASVVCASNMHKKISPCYNCVDREIRCKKKADIRRNNENVGFRIVFSMKDEGGNVIATGVSPAIMITNNRKALNNWSQKNIPEYDMLSQSTEPLNLEKYSTCFSGIHSDCFGKCYEYEPKTYEFDPKHENSHQRIPEQHSNNTTINETDYVTNGLPIATYDSFSGEIISDATLPYCADNEATNWANIIPIDTKPISNPYRQDYHSMYNFNNAVLTGMTTATTIPRTRPIQFTLHDKFHCWNKKLLEECLSTSGSEILPTTDKEILEEHQSYIPPVHPVTMSCSDFDNISKLLEEDIDELLDTWNIISKVQAGNICYESKMNPQPLEHSGIFYSTYEWILQ